MSFLDGPAITRSSASSISEASITDLLRRAATKAASFNTFSKSAPTKPGVCCATNFKSTSSAKGLFLAWTFKIASRPLTSGRPTNTFLSKRPGRSRAGSRTSERFVAAITIIPSFPSKPSISIKSWFKVCSRSSLPPPKPTPRWRPTASISSMKIIAGAAFFASSKRERTRLAPTPTNISTKSEPEILKNGTPASPATALASNVLPVPGGPSKRTPAGIRAPNFVNRFGSFKNSTTSTSSCFSSSAPATSEKRTLISSLLAALALLRPKLIGLRPLFPPIFPIIEKRKKNKIANGTTETRMLIHIPLELSCFTSICV